MSVCKRRGGNRRQVQGDYQEISRIRQTQNPDSPATVTAETNQCCCQLGGHQPYPRRVRVGQRHSKQRVAFRNAPGEKLQRCREVQVGFPESTGVLLFEP
jgi:hypothetical protein